MKFMGSKSKIAKHIIPIITKNIGDRTYVEPFAGGMNVVDKINVSGRVIAADIHPQLISMWNALQSGWIPPASVSRDDYYRCKDGHESRYMVGWVGFNASYCGRYFEGYAGQVETETGLVRDYYDEARRNVLTQIESLKKVEFINSSYLDLDIPNNSVIYCDPPYKATKKYRYNIDHEQFWQWAREKSVNNDVYISEYEAPPDFVCVWQKEVSSSLRANGVISGAKSNIERLFVHESKLVEGNADAE
ncbi:DNA adenine methylase [Yersinia enterocolitica]